MKPIAEAWKLYLKTVVPENAGPIQKRETEIAFYAGAHTVYQMIIAMSTWKPEVTEKFMSAFDKEMKEYRAKIGYESFMEKVARGGE